MDQAELLARQEISDALYRYARGIDRMDWELVRSAFHPDARDDHGWVAGTVDELLDYVASSESLPGFERTMHYVAHQHITVEGLVADAETYCLAHHVAAEGHAWGPALVVIGLRYIDRFECRDGRWAIAERTCAYEWASKLPVELDPNFFPPGTVRGRRDRYDAVYTMGGPRAGA